MPTSPSAAHPPRGDGLSATGRVPAEHRVLGLDRRSLLPGLIVIGLFVFWTVLIPGVNSLLSYDDTTEAGDVFVLAPDVTMTARAGWGIESGLRTTDATIVPKRGGPVLLTRDGVQMKVTPGPFAGDPATLLDRIEKVPAVNGSGDSLSVSGDAVAFRTDDGTPGLAQHYRTPQGEGLAAALVVGETGIEVLATGPGTSLGAQSDDIEAMIESIRLVPVEEAAP